MRCAWKELLGILPQAMQTEVDRLGRSSLMEIRLRIGSPGQLVTGEGITTMSGTVTPELLHFVVNTASKYSPWNAATAAKGYITAPGGHRIGLAGECVCREGQVSVVKNLTSICIRVARDFQGIATGIPIENSLLILGPPGSGKTTLLRDLIRRISDSSEESICVVDERGELFPPNAGFFAGRNTDILTGCEKAPGMDMALRTMGPGWIAVDEITSEGDCDAMVRSGWCGVKLLATAHASGIQDLLAREVYRPLVKTGLFEHIIVLQKDKSWRLERIRK